MEKMSLKELAVPLIKAIDSFNYLLKSHHRRTAVISYAIGYEMGLRDQALTDLVVAAAIHDIGALSVQERDSLITEDVVNPDPHCLMGYKMLKSFETFEHIALILKHHHIKYSQVDLYLDAIPIQSHIIHLADRVDILVSVNKFILDQKQEVLDKLEANTGSIFHPDVFEALKKVARADIFWININNMLMEQILSKVDYKLEVELSKDQIIEFSSVISRIVDFRSRYTATHSFTVGRLAYKIGKILKNPDEYNTKLLIAGYLHDIGKIGIDPGIIEKKGELDDSEFNQIKLHSYYSGQILNELSNNAWFVDIVKWTTNHHEKNDNSGYPYALGTDEIDQGTYIIAFADIISALMENRPYRDSLSIDEATKIIDTNFADNLDRDIFNAILENLDTIESLVHFCQKEGLALYKESISN